MTNKEVAGFRQGWVYTVEYVPFVSDDARSEIKATVLAESHMTVYEFLTRKFLRIAKRINSIQVTDAGFLLEAHHMALRKNGETIEMVDGTGKVHSVEERPVYGRTPSAPPNQSTLPAVISAPKYVPAPPLAENPVFTKVNFPSSLYESRVSANQFQAKFYTVFPKEF